MSEPALSPEAPAAPASDRAVASARAVGVAAVGLAGILWGASAVVIKGAFNQHVDPLTLVQARLAIASLLLALGLAAFAPQLLRVRLADLTRLVVWGCGGLLLVQGGYYSAVSLAGVATALFMQYTSPVLTATWERLVSRERLGAPVLAALAACTAGLCALLFGGGAQIRISGLAVLAGALSSLGSAFNVVYGKRAMARLHPATLLLYGMVAAFLVTLAVRWPPDTWRALYPAHAGQVAYVAAFATLVPFLLYLIGLSRLRPLETMLLALVEPVVGVLGAWAFLGERLTPTQIGGGLAVLVGVGVAELRRRT